MREGGTEGGGVEGIYYSNGFAVDDEIDIEIDDEIDIEVEVDIDVDDVVAGMYVCIR